MVTVNFCRPRCVLEPVHCPLLCILPDVLEQPDLMDILRVS